MSHSEQRRDRFYPWWYLVPLYPYGYKPTLRQVVVEDWIWTLEQYQGIFYVVVPTRMTIVRLQSGGLLIYGAIAATAECIGLIRELEAQYGNVQYLILPTISGLEHKAYVAPFARHFPEVEVYVAPGQWSFPVNLPLSWLGFPRKRTYILPTDSRQTPFSSEFDYRILGPLDLKLGKFGEVAFFHRRSQTLLVTDTLISIPESPPKIVEINAYPLLFHAKDKAGERVIDNQENRRKGWQRICLFSLYFQAHSLQIKPLLQAWQESQHEGERGFHNFFGIFPFHWQSNWQQSFQQLWGEGRLLVAPILQQLILNRYPELTLNWVEKICEWPFTRIIPAHFEIPLSATPEEFRQAFTFLEKQLLPDQKLLLPPRSPLISEDFAALQAIDQFLCRYKIIPPAQLKGRSQFAPTDQINNSRLDQEGRTQFVPTDQINKQLDQEGRTQFAPTGQIHKQLDQE